MNLTAIAAALLARTRASWDPAITGDWADTVAVPSELRPDADDTFPRATPRLRRLANDHANDRLLGIA